jgi:ZIP family zinc transporter
MKELMTIMLATWLAGVTAFIGGLVARVEGSMETTFKRELVHGIVAFGGGILVAAIAFALAPEGMKYLSPAVLAATFCAGGIGFCLLDRHLSSQGGSKAQFMAMLMDFVPEAISLGAVFGHDRRLGMLLAAFIGAQNLPEGFNAFREVVKSGTKPRTALVTLFAVSFLGPVAGCIGYFFLQGNPALTAGIMSFAAGGILYLIFQDIAPDSTMRRHPSPPLGAVLGFVVGMVGKQVIG